MAATVSAWAKPGAWALDSEENEAELLHQRKEELSNNHQSNGGAAESDFPSLAAAAATKTKKKKPQTLSLQEFVTYGGAGEKQSYSAAKGLNPEELLTLPTGPRQRTAEELDRTRLGGGFRSFDTRSSRGSSDEPRRQGSFNRESSKEFAPSRADEIDNWAAAKKSPVGNGFERRERGGFFSDSQSRADEVDNWAKNKAATFVPSEGRRYDRREGGFESNGGAADSDNWVKRKEEEGPKFGGSFDSLRSRRGSNESMNSSDSDTWGRKREEVSNAVAGTRPRLTLQPRTLPVDKEQQNGSANEVKPKGSNPFGEARPREAVLKEKGQDSKEIDEKLEAGKIKEVTTKSADAASFGKRGFGSGKGSANLPEDRTEMAWRKPEHVDARPSSSEKSENGHVEETQDREPQA